MFGLDISTAELAGRIAAEEYGSPGVFRVELEHIRTLLQNDGGRRKARARLRYGLVSGREGGFFETCPTVGGRASKFPTTPRFVHTAAFTRWSRFRVAQVIRSALVNAGRLIRPISAHSLPAIELMFGGRRWLCCRIRNAQMQAFAGDRQGLLPTRFRHAPNTQFRTKRE